MPDKQAADALPEIVRQTPVPLIADIHFDYRWALAAIRAGFHGLRLNPGNIRDVDKVKTVVKEAKERGIPIRIGVNAGSLPPIRALAGRRAAADAWSTAWSTRRMWEIKILEDMDYDNIKISMKAFDVPTMVEANRRLAPTDPLPAAPRRHRGGHCRAPAPSAAPSASASCWRRASATRSASRSPPTRSKRSRSAGTSSTR